MMFLINYKHKLILYKLMRLLKKNNINVNRVTKKDQNWSSLRAPWQNGKKPTHRTTQKHVEHDAAKDI